MLFACNGSVAINFAEMIVLLRELSAFRAKSSKETPIVHVYDNQSAGYTLWTEANADDTNYACFITDLAEKRGLKVREFKNYLIIYST
jgi:hypothetical protein